MILSREQINKIANCGVEKCGDCDMGAKKNKGEAQCHGYNLNANILETLESVWDLLDKEKNMHRLLKESHSGLFAELEQWKVSHAKLQLELDKYKKESENIPIICENRVSYNKCINKDDCPSTCARYKEG